jgi:hypothetical protein
MASRETSILGLLFTLPVLVAFCGCSAGERRFPLREPLWQDSDLRPVRARCHAAPTPKDPGHISCAPDSRELSDVWDGADNSFFRPLSESVGIWVGGDSIDVNSLDEVPDSSWFQNRIGVRPMSAAELALGDCEPEQLLDPESFADGSWVIDKGKSGGQTDGFRVVIPGKGKYLLKAEDSEVSEHSSAAQSVGAAIYHAAGYYTTCEQVIYFKRSLLKLTPGLRWRHNFETDSPFDQAALDRVLAHCPSRGDTVRMQASEWLSGYPLGGFDYEGTRGDDPNDVVPHEDRRELRAMRVLNSWFGRFDARGPNTLDMWIEDASAPQGSGHVLHNQMDTSEALGSEWGWSSSISRRLGYSYVVDWGDMAADFFTLGIPTRTWDTIEREPGKETFVYFNVKDFVADEWKNEYPIPAYSRMTERDAAWMTRILARFTPEAIHTLAQLARFSNPDDTQYLETVLEGRLEKIRARYLTRLSPVADVRVEGRDKLCGVDLAELRGVRAPTAFQYRARRPAGAWLEVERRPGAVVCVTLPRVAPDGGPADDAPDRYLRVRIEDGVAPGPLVAHLYDLGPTRGYRLVGLERPDR